MALTTSNVYGNITISDDAVAMLINKVASDCYGVLELVSRRLTDSLLMLFKKIPVAKGVKLVSVGNQVFVDIYVIFKSGINKEAVINSLKSTILYNVEYSTGMRVKSINVHVVGIKF